MGSVELREMTDIEAHAARLAAAREHWRCEAHDAIGITGCFTSRLAAGALSPMLCIRDGVKNPRPAERCQRDHHTAAERKAAALEAGATLWAWFADAPPTYSLDYNEYLSLIYDRIQREEATDA